MESKKGQKMGSIENQPGKEAHASPLGEGSLLEKKEPHGCQDGVKPPPNRARWQSVLEPRTV